MALLLAISMGGGQKGYDKINSKRVKVFLTVCPECQITPYTLDLASGLTQVLTAGPHTYLYGNMRLAQHTSTTTEYFLTDALGSVRQLVDENGMITLSQAYQPYGESLSSDGTGTSSYGFTGEWTDGTGLVHLRARYYAPGQGRFLSQDPSRLEQNLYLYASADPVNRRDPLGLYSCETATVDSGDNAWDIWAVYGQPYMSWDAFKQANTHIPDLGSIFAGYTIYVPGYCPASPSENNPPTTTNQAYFNVYVEGRGAVENISAAVTKVRGIEIVYNFSTRQRQTFVYVENPLEALGGACGLTIDVGSIGVTTSSYAGVYHMDAPDISYYQGVSAVFSAGVSVSIPMPIPPPPPWGSSIGLGFNLAASVDPNYSTLGFPGVPNLNSNMTWGASLEVNISVGANLTDGPRVATHMSVMYVRYMPVGVPERYDNIEQMITDIRSGANTYIPGARGAVGIPPLSTARESAVQRLQEMYALP